VISELQIGMYLAAKIWHFFQAEAVLRGSKSMSRTAQVLRDCVLDSLHDTGNARNLTH
jgi:hypothetical protein